MWRKQLTLFLSIPGKIPKKFLKSFQVPLSPFPGSFSFSSSCQLEVSPLKSRSLIRLRGQEGHGLLQGLVTNDLSHLEQKPSIFTLLLNHQGRILFDAIVSHPLEEDSPEEQILIECDTSFRSKLVSHLKLYRLKRKVDIEAEDNLTVWVVYDATHIFGYHKSSGSTANDLSNYCCETLAKSSSNKRDNLPLTLDLGKDKATHFRDPRLPELGWRIYAPSGTKTVELFKELKSSCGLSVKDSEEGYKALRYCLGVGEGVGEIPFGSAFPLEANGDYLHGISFQKGCYLGQELTARTHHTGVVRKRLMPFRLTDAADKIHGDIQSFQILNEKNRPVGKVRGLHGNLGIALFRVEETLSSSSLTLNDSLVTVAKPSWWPIEAAKEISSARKP